MTVRPLPIRPASSTGTVPEPSKPVGPWRLGRRLSSRRVMIRRSWVHGLAMPGELEREVEPHVAIGDLDAPPDRRAA